MSFLSKQIEHFWDYLEGLKLTAVKIFSKNVVIIKNRAECPFWKTDF